MLVRNNLQKMIMSHFQKKIIMNFGLTSSFVKGEKYSKPI